MLNYFNPFLSEFCSVLIHMFCSDAATFALVVTLETSAILIANVSMQADITFFFILTSLFSSFDTFRLPCTS